MAVPYWQLAAIGIAVIASGAQHLLRKQNPAVADSDRRRSDRARHLRTELVALAVVFQFFGGMNIPGFTVEILPMHLSAPYENVVRTLGIVMELYTAIFTNWPLIVRWGSWGSPKMPSSQIPGHFLCTSGPYRYARHPYYGASIVGISGLELIVTSYMFFIVLAVLLIDQGKLAREEERLLEAEFGAAYRGYMRRTWRFVPFVY